MVQPRRYIVAITSLANGFAAMSPGGTKRNVSLVAGDASYSVPALKSWLSMQPDLDVRFQR